MADGNGNSGAVVNSLTAPNGDFSAFMASVTEGAYQSTPSALPTGKTVGLTDPSGALSPEQLSLLTAVMTGGETNGLQFDRANFSEKQWAAAMSIIVSNLRPSLTAGEPVNCAGCDFLMGMPQS